MSTLYSVAAALGLAVLALGAQPARGQAAAPRPRVCATQAADDYQQTELQRRLPGYSGAKLVKADPVLLRTTATTYTLPVIVHIIHNGEAVGTGTNLSQAQVLSQIAVLNEDYRNKNADGASAPGAFQPLRADVQVQFVPAEKDPSGNRLAEPGIDRVDRTTKSFLPPPYGGTSTPNTAYIDATIKPQTVWNPDQYVNIWVMDLNGGGLLGYAQFPDNTAGLGGLSALGGAAATDGVVIKHSAFGSRAKNPTGTYLSNFDRGRTLTHELGHWLGLRHIWGDSNCGNDYCADTPTQQTSNIGCPSFPHQTCSNGASGDMFMNYMDYSNDACMDMFSANQKDRMQAVMAANTPRRTSLLTSPVLCTSVLAASATNTGATCPGGSIGLRATGPAGASYFWNGPNGFTSTEQNPTLANVTAATAGTYTVTVANASGACPGTATTAVAVSPAPPKPQLATTTTAVCPGTSATLSATNLARTALPNENFDGAAPGWTLANAGAVGTDWQLRAAPYSYTSTYLTLTSYSPNGSRFVLANSDSGGGAIMTNTTLTSPVFSTVGYSALQVAFQQYYLNDADDMATVEISTDGGTTWVTLASYTSNQGTASSPATAIISLNAYLNQPTARLRWHYQASWGYVWALDNVAVTGTAAPLSYAWTLVSGDGLPTTTTGPALTVTPSRPSVYRLTVSSAGLACTASDTISVGLSNPVWTGKAGNGNWFDAANWIGCVPTSLTNALVPAGLSTPYPTLAGGRAEVATLTQQGGLTVQAGTLALYGDYTGTGPLTQTGGALTTAGTGPQTLRAATYLTLQVGGTGLKTIGAATINKELTLAGPVLQTATTLTLGPGALLVETDASYVLGRVQTTHDLGSGTDNFGLLGVTITPASPLGLTTIVRTTGQPQGVGAASSISRYFDITAASSRGLQGATLTQQYLPHELNGLPESQLAMFRSTDAGVTWSNEGATQRDATAKTVSRAYVTDLQGRWTLASPASPLRASAVTYAINAFPVPFGADGLSVQVTTAAAGPLSVQLYDVLGRVIYDYPVANVEVGTSTVSLPGSGQLLAGKYILVVRQASQTARLNVVRQ